jgi:hypothetical protein
VNQLKTFNFREAQEQIDMIIKWVYFEKESDKYLPVEIKDLIEGSQRD